MTVAPLSEQTPVEAVENVTSLPDPLVMLDGKKVTTAKQWEKDRRPELKRLFQHYMYGYMPAAPKKVVAKVEREEKRYFGSKATKREVTIHYGPEGTPGYPSVQIRRPIAGRGSPAEPLRLPRRPIERT